MSWARKPHDCAVHGHKFEARYDYKGPGMQAKVKAADPQDAIDFMRAAGDQTYIKDICVYCGLSVDREHTGEAVELLKVVG